MLILALFFVFIIYLFYLFIHLHKNHLGVLFTKNNFFSQYLMISLWISAENYNFWKNLSNHIIICERS